VIEPACWSWEPPAVLTREQEAERLHNESMDLCLARDSRDHYLPMSACMMLTRDWPLYQLDAFHRGRCALCGAGVDHLVLDHEHRTGLVRGRLCHGCNVSEGRGAGGAVDLYRERPPSAIVGVEVYYVGRGWDAGWWNDGVLARRLTGNPGWVPIAV
jgi:hypothetical protein